MWDKEQSQSLVTALIEKQFVPPVTIGSYVENNKKQNLILDGQQRLTSLLLHYFGVFPKRDRYDLYAALMFCMKFYDRLPGISSFICVDEGQDMSLNEYRLINDLNHREVTFNIYGDVNQLLKPGRGISDWDNLKNEFAMKEFQLNENYRNTNQITRFCNSSFEMNIMQTGVDGAKVREIPRRELEKELANLNLMTERVAILVSRSVRRKSYLAMDTLPTNISSAIGQKIDNGFISFMYVDEVKGIEFDKVYVISNKMTKNEKYIAYTRALSELIIVVDETIVEQAALEE